MCLCRVVGGLTLARVVGGLTLAREEILPDYHNFDRNSSRRLLLNIAATGSASQGTPSLSTQFGILWYTVGRRGSVLACATCKREISGSIAGWAEFAVDAVLLSKVSTHTCTLSTQE